MIQKRIPIDDNPDLVELLEATYAGARIESACIHKVIIDENDVNVELDLNIEGGWGIHGKLILDLEDDNTVAEKLREIISLEDDASDNASLLFRGAVKRVRCVDNLTWRKKLGNNPGMIVVLDLTVGKEYDVVHSNVGGPYRLNVIDDTGEESSFNSSQFEVIEWREGEFGLMDKCKICRNICETEAHYHLGLYFCDNCWAEFQDAKAEAHLTTKRGALLNIELDIIDALYVKHNPEKT